MSAHFLVVTRNFSHSYKIIFKLKKYFFWYGIFTRYYQMPDDYYYCYFKKHITLSHVTKVCPYFIKSTYLIETKVSRYNQIS